MDSMNPPLVDGLNVCCYSNRIGGHRAARPSGAAG
jgi:hypothetical protein